MSERSREIHLQNEVHQNVGDGLNEALSGLEAHNVGLNGVLERLDLTRKVGSSKLPDRKLYPIINHFGEHRLRSDDFEFPDLLGDDVSLLIIRRSRFLAAPQMGVGIPYRSSLDIIQLAENIVFQTWPKTCLVLNYNNNEEY